MANCSYALLEAMIALAGALAVLFALLVFIVALMQAKK